MIRHLWFDPGNTTGWALYEDDTPKLMGTLTYPDQFFQFWNAEFFDTTAIMLYGYEDYRLMPKGMKTGYTPAGSRVEAIQCIGVIKFMAHRRAAQTVCQDRQAKPAGYGYAGLPPYDPNKKGMHMQDAIAHGAFWWMEKGRHIECL